MLDTILPARLTQPFGRTRVKSNRVRLVDWFSCCCASCSEESCASGQLNGRAAVWGPGRCGEAMVCRQKQIPTGGDWLQPRFIVANECLLDKGMKGRFGCGLVACVAPRCGAGGMMWLRKLCVVAPVGSRSVEWRGNGVAT